MVVKCALCGLKGDKNLMERFDDKNFHKDCLSEYKYKKKIHHYVCYLFGLKSPGPRIFKQLNDYITKNKFTYQGIYKTLIYFYEIKGGDVKKANAGIGIVPYVYLEAKDYFGNIQLQRKRVEELVKNQREQEKLVLKVKRKKSKRKSKVDFDELEREELNDT